MKIDKHNCESYFLDYYEKNLSPVEVAEVLFFLEENPELKEVFESYEAICLEHEKINFPDKEALKKKYSAEEITAILSSDISRTNCEQFFIANAEGILSSSQKEKINLFLLQYPELKKEHELFRQCRLSAEKISFEGKEALKKELITNENREEYFFRAIENDLNLSEQKALNIFLAKHPEYKTEFELFSKTIISPETISFENKSSLKKRKRKPVFVTLSGVEGSQRTTYYAAAAAILLLVGLFFFFKNDGTEKQMLADKNKPVKKSEQVVVPQKESIPNKANTVQEKQIQKDEHPNNRTPDSYRDEQSNVKVQKPEAIEEKKQLQPIIFEDNENLVAEKEQEKPKMMEQEVIAEKKQEEKKEDGVNEAQAIASAVTPKSNDDYQTLGSFARKKVKSVLGIKEAAECETADKLTLWDFAMAAKGGIQNLIGTKAIDVNKVCDGTGESEYVFTAGNFEISRNASK